MTAVSDPTEVLSGEAVAIDVQPVGFFMRTLGAVIDITLSVAALVVGLTLYTWIAGVGFLDDATSRIFTVSLLVFALVILPCGIEVLLRGRSLGKLAVGGRIVRIDGGTTGFRHAFIRAIVGVFEIYFTAGAVAIVAGAFSPRAQRLGDMVAGTYSQTVRSTMPPEFMPVMPQSLVSWAPLADVARLPDRLSRRITQFLRTAPQMSAHARVRVAEELVAETREFVSPQPNAPAEDILIAMMTIRRQREYRSLQIANQRVNNLTNK